MTGHVQIEIYGGEARLTVDFLRRASSEVQDEWEGDGVMARIRAQTSSTEVDFIDRVRLFDLERFRECLEREDGTLTWAAWLGDAKEYLTVSGKRDALGGLRLAVRVPHPLGNKKYPEFDVETDEASLSALRTQVDRVLARFPQRVAWGPEASSRYGQAQGPGAEGVTADLMERLRERAQDPDIRVSGGHSLRDSDGNVFVFTTRPPATAEQVTAAEARLGFILPSFLRRVYLEVGNGGFGPGFGMLSLPTSPAPPEEDEGGFDLASELDTVLMYELSRRFRTDLSWPTGLLIICYWGCGMASAVDCTKPEAPVIRLDPNWTREEAEPRLPEDCRTEFAAAFEEGCWVEAHAFETWLRAWLDDERAFEPTTGPYPSTDDTSWFGEEDHEFLDEDENPGADDDLVSDGDWTALQESLDARYP